MTRRRSTAKIAYLTCVAIAVSGCAAPVGSGGPAPFSGLKETFASDDPCSNNARNIGVLLGALGGALIAKQMGSEKDQLTGAVVGGALGAFIGRDIDQRRCELSKLAKLNNTEAYITTLKAADDKGAAQPVGLTSAFIDAHHNAQFQPNSDVLTPSAQKLFVEVADQYSPAKRMANAKTQEEKNSIAEMKLLVIGHTDDTEDSKSSAQLSELRAKRVAKVLHDGGVSDDKIYFQGAGESLPLADNHTAEGRAKNRSVEVMEFKNEKVMQHFLETRNPNVSFYRNPEERPAAGDKPYSPSVASDASTTAAAKAQPKPATPPTASKNVAQKTQPVPVDKTAKVTNTTPTPTTTTTSTRTNAPASNADKPGDSHPVAAAGNGKGARTPVEPGAARADVGGGIDFGGQPVGTFSPKINIGDQTPPTTFSLISNANAAAEVLAQDCLKDRPRISSSVKSLKDNREYQIREFLPGMYGKTWTDMVNGHLVTISDVSVLRDGAMPAKNPRVSVYKNFNFANGKLAKPDYSELSQVNTYKGSEGVLYRVFAPAGAPLRCMDIVLPVQAPVNKSKQSYIYYPGSARINVSQWSPSYN